MLLRLVGETSHVTDAIRLEGVTKSFGTKVAVRELDMTIPQGSMVGFIGPNGAGKTTTIRMIMSILFQDRGKIEVLGRPSALDAKDRIGYLPEERGVYKRMKVGAFLRYMARLKGEDGSDVGAKVRRWLERVGLGDVESKKCEELSKGMQQKVQFIASVIHEPDLVILDEPFSGLDPVNMRLLRDLVREQHQRGATVIFSTHVMFQAEQLCDHILMINDGDKVLDESLASIRARYDPRQLIVEPLDPQADVGALRSLPAVREVARPDKDYELQLADGAALPEAMAAVTAAMPVARLEIRRPTLEDVFVQIVTGSRAVSADEARDLRSSLRNDDAGEVAS
jgi:ABC-2 type transport system ATP-binding protein